MECLVSTDHLISYLWSAVKTLKVDSQDDKNGTTLINMACYFGTFGV